MVIALWLADTTNMVALHCLGHPNSRMQRIFSAETRPKSIGTMNSSILECIDPLSRIARSVSEAAPESSQEWSSPSWRTIRWMGQDYYRSQWQVGSLRLTSYSSNSLDVYVSCADELFLSSNSIPLKAISSHGYNAFRSSALLLCSFCCVIALT